MYSASKSALAAWSDALAAETAALGVKVTCLEPGGFRTNFASSSLKSGRHALPAYAESVAAVKQRYAEAAGVMPNDPRRAAVVIDQLVELETPPVRVALGEDGHTYLTNALLQRVSDYEKTHSMSADTAFETAGSG
jgi:NAD(P)-dependent dehydrogenase (short-subunit alcohol dehydrogenase family)